MTQYFSTIVSSANAIAANAGTTQQVAALSLAAGDWMVDGELWLAVTSGTPTVTSAMASLSLNPGADAGSEPMDNLAASLIEPGQTKQVSTTYGWVMPLTTMRINTTSATTVYLNCKANWTGGGTMSMYGKIFASGTAANALVSSGNFVYLHLADGSEEGYINVGMAQFIEPNAAGGSRLRIENRVINVIEAASDILGAMS